MPLAAAVLAVTGMLVATLSMAVQAAVTQWGMVEQAERPEAVRCLVAVVAAAAEYGIILAMAFTQQQRAVNRAHTRVVTVVPAELLVSLARLALMAQTVFAVPVVVAAAGMRLVLAVQEGQAACQAVVVAVVAQALPLAAMEAMAVAVR